MIDTPDYDNRHERNRTCCWIEEVAIGDLMVTTMNKTAEPNTRALKWQLEKEKLVFNNVSELLECPVCVTIMSAPIYQCPNGHTLCSMCKSRVENCCPVCRTDMGSIRCLALEKVAKPLEVPYDCPSHDRGCRATSNIPELVTHLKNDHYAKLAGRCEIKANFIQPLSK
ncbi:E3 ubiquitin protein ligase SINAT2-like protein [Tanacetum coccineum]